jgi:hypothetical protein
VTNYATDLVVNSSGQAGTYTTLSAALSAAASSGDRILIPSTITLIEDITINKSIDIMPQTEGNYFYLEGDINITATAGLEIRILGMNFSGDLVCSSGTATETNRCHLYFIDCKVTDPGTTDISAEQIGLAFHVLYCYMPDTNVSLKFGEIIGCHLNNFIVSNTDQSFYDDTIKILANIFDSRNYSTISTSFPSYTTKEIYSCYDNSSHYYIIANNFFKFSNYSNANRTKLSIFGSNNVGNGKNEIINNTIVSSISPGNYAQLGMALTFHNDYDGSVKWSRPNTDVLNNIFIGNSWDSFNTYLVGLDVAGAISLPFIKYNCFSNGGGLSSDYYSDNINNGIHELSPRGDAHIPALLVIDPSNYNMTSATFNSTGYVISKNGRGVGGITTNSGKNEANSYDLDMTRNDLGTYGGPYSMENYWDSTATGKARIYHLDMPSEIWSGQTPTIKATAVHKK